MENVKCLTVGDEAVGKTCLVMSYVNNTFPGDHIPTTFDNYSANVMVDSQVVKLQLCDAGHDACQHVRPLHYASTDVVLLCFSIVSRTSMEKVRIKWAPEIKRHNPDATIVLCGTKLDLRGDADALQQLHAQGREPVSVNEGAFLAKEIGAHAYVEASSVTQEGMKGVFDACIRHAVRNKNKARRRKSNPLAVCLPLLSAVL